MGYGFGMKLPAIIVNFKIYPNAVGEGAVGLARICEKVAVELGVSIGVCVNALDLAMVAREVTIPVFAQHFDVAGFGSNTGAVNAEMLAAAGVYGSLLNHAERPLSDNVILQAIEAAKGSGLFTIVCANDVARGVAVLEMGADLVAVEPPELIGGDISISKAQAEVIEEAVLKIGGERLLVGAGVRDYDDVRLACEMGASGVLLASGVVKADDPEAALRELARGLK